MHQVVAGRSAQTASAPDTAQTQELRIKRARLVGPRALSVIIHDVAPATQPHCEQVIAFVNRAGVAPVTLLVVPCYHHQATTPAFERWIETRLRHGDELALHGFTHLDESAPSKNWADRVRRQWYTDGEGEFAAIDAVEARKRLEAGLRWFAERGWPVRGFVAPAWLMGWGAWAALHAQSLDYTCTLNDVIGLTHDERAVLRARSLVFSTRAAWRRHVSLVWNTVLGLYQRDAPLMRVELHPSDVLHADVRRAIERMLASARDQQREMLTLGAVAQRLEATRDA